jgi:hypothetical protein
MRIACCLLVLFAAATGSRAQDVPLSQILIPGEEWKKVEGTFKPIRVLTSYSSDVVNVWDDELRLQATINPKDLRGTPTAGDGRIQTDRFAIDDGIALVLDRKNRKVLLERGYDTPEIIKTVQLPLAEPSAMWAPAELGTALIADAASKYIWAYRIERGGLSAGEKYISVRLGKAKTRSDASDIRTDPVGRIFVATNEGVQIFDPTGRLCGVVPGPAKGRVATLCVTGESAEGLFIACGNEVYVRKLNPTMPASSSAKPK